MVRTQIYLEEEIHKALSKLARQEKASMAKIARDILKEGIEKRKTTDTSGKDVLEGLLTSAITGGPNDLSKNIDHYLYGGPKKK